MRTFLATLITCLCLTGETLAQNVDTNFDHSMLPLTLRATTIASQSANYNVTRNDSVILLNGNLTATLPTAVGISGKSFTIVCKTAGTNAILTTSAQTFLGYGSTAASKWTNSVVGRSTTVMSDGANWVVLKSDN